MPSGYLIVCCALALNRGGESLGGEPESCGPVDQAICFESDTRGIGLGHGSTSAALVYAAEKDNGLCCGMRACPLPGFDSIVRWLWGAGSSGGANDDCLKHGF